MSMVVYRKPWVCDHHFAFAQGLCEVIGLRILLNLFHNLILRVIHFVFFCEFDNDGCQRLDFIAMINMAKCP